MTERKLQGRLAVVTGGASGIGAEIATQFASAGATVVIVDMNPAGAEAVAAQLGSQHQAAHVDVTDHDAVLTTMQQISERHERIDILVNCAGYSKFGAVEELTAEDWRHTIDVNLSGTFYCSIAAARTMMRRHEGKIVNVASLAGLVGIPNQSAYVAAKHGVIGLTRALAIDLGPYGINVNCVAPGTTLTPMAIETRSQEFLEQEPNHHPLGRLATTADQAHAVMFLASSDADYLTGVVIPVDGGRLIALRTRTTQA